MLFFYMWFLLWAVIEMSLSQYQPAEKVCPGWMWYHPNGSGNSTEPSYFWAQLWPTFLAGPWWGWAKGGNCKHDCWFDTFTMHVISMWAFFMRFALLNVDQAEKFCGSLVIPHPELPEHRSASCVVLRARTPKTQHCFSLKRHTLTQSAHRYDGRNREVVIKLMKDRKQYESETKPGGSSGVYLRDGHHVVDILLRSEDTGWPWYRPKRIRIAMRWFFEESAREACESKRWAHDAARWGYPGYEHGIAMPAAQRNLMMVILQERIAPKRAMKIFSQLGECLRHMHEECDMIHSDFKPLNCGTKKVYYTFSCVCHVFSLTISRACAQCV